MEDTHYGVWLLVLTLSVYIVKQATRGAYYNGRKQLDGRTIIITGANAGIGFETAIEIAKRHASVILACRDRNRGLQAVEKIIRLSSNKNVRYKQLDLASLKSVREFCDNIKKEENSIYALINNAGIFWCPLHWTEDRFEANFGVNHLGHFLLNILLLPLLIKNKDGSRIITISSIMHVFGRIDFSDLNYQKRSYNFVSAYSDSKLANVFFTQSLAEKLNNTNVKIVCADPGIVYSDIGRNSPFMSSVWYKVILRPIVWLLFKNTSGGAQTTLYCLLSDEFKKENGIYFSECEQRYPWPSAQSRTVRDKLWKESLRLVNMTNDAELF